VSDLPHRLVAALLTLVVAAGLASLAAGLA